MGCQITQNDVEWFAEQMRRLKTCGEAIRRNQQVIKGANSTLKAAEEDYGAARFEILEFYKKFDLASSSNMGWEGRLLEFLPLLFDGVKATNT